MDRSRHTRDRGPGSRRPPRDELVTCSDEQLVELVLDGHDLAFEVLFDRHVADSLWYAREALGSWGEAEEAVRHSFAAAHAYLAARGHETEFRPWLQTILANYCLSMLQARTPTPEEASGDSAVVDLGEWRLRRKLSGVGLPVAPAAGLRESLMAACGIGAGAATAGSPLLGGTLAKLAVVAVLAGGAGVAADAVSDRAAPVDGGSRPVVERMADADGARGGAVSPVRDSAGRVDGSTVSPARERVGSPKPARAQAEAPGRVAPGPPAGSPPAADDPSAAGSVPPVVARATTDVAATGSPAPAPVRAGLRQTLDAIEAQVGAGGSLPQVKVDRPLDIAKIDDDLGVTALKPPVDVRPLLSRGASVLSK